MKSRRHRAIDKAEKELPMIGMNLKNKIYKKRLNKAYKKIVGIIMTQ